MHPTRLGERNGGRSFDSSPESETAEPGPGVMKGFVNVSASRPEDETSGDDVEDPPRDRLKKAVSDFILDARVRKCSCPESGASGYSQDSVLPKLRPEFAKMRSYLVGSIAGESLLGAPELDRYFPDRKLSIYVVTWNMNGQGPPKNLDDILFPSESSTVADFYVVGTQESFPAKQLWEVRLQETLGPSHVLLQSVVLGTLHLCLFLRRDLIWFCSVPDEGVFSIRPPTTIKTKGAVCMAIMFFGTSLLFVNSHLSAELDRVQDRVQDYQRIIAGVEIPSKLPIKSHTTSEDMTSRFDAVFWLGDLNFRLAGDRDKIVSLVTDDNGSPKFDSAAYTFDQLTALMRHGSAFKGFQESAISFPPTYKYEPGTNLWDTVKLRTPSYTDRILYKSRLRTEIECLKYRSVQAIKTSDHKPVWGLFRVSLRPGRDNIPLSAGLFQRDVYLEALKRRAMALEYRRKSKNVASAACSVQ